MTNPVQSLDDFVAFVRGAPLGVIATTGEFGPEAALLSFAATPAGNLLLKTPDGTRKRRNILANCRVAAVIGTAGGVSLQVEGEASVLTGQELLTADAVYEQELPGAHPLIPGWSIIQIVPLWIRRYDARVSPPDVFAGAPGWREPAGI